MATNLVGSIAVQVSMLFSNGLDLSTPLDKLLQKFQFDLANGVGEHLQEVNGVHIKHERFQYECLGCGEEFGPEIAPLAVRTVKAMGPRPAMVESLKLDRRIVHVETGEVYANACRVWKAGLVSSSQCDRMSAALYGAAKRNDFSAVKVNGHTFVLACATTVKG